MMRALTWIVLVLLAPALSGCMASDTDTGDAGDGTTSPEEEPFEPVAATFEGEFLAGGFDEPITHSFDVPEGATEVAGLLTWEIPGAVLDFAFIDPTGKENGNGWAEGDSHRYVTNTYTIQPGTWSVVVTAEEGADIHYTMQVEARQAEPIGPIAKTYTIQPRDPTGAGQATGQSVRIDPGFAEINFNMDAGDFFTYEWESTGDVYFNIHFHDNGETNRSTELEAATSHSGTFEAPFIQVFSLVWVNRGTEPVDVQVHVDGQYRLHSMHRDPPDDP